MARRIPQSRRRLFIVGILRSAGAAAFRFPEGGSPATNLQEILEPDGDLPERFDFSDTYRNALLRAKDMNHAKGSNHGYMFANRKHFNALMSRASGTEKNIITRPGKTWRRPTPLEYQRAQGFPENYDLSSVSVGRQYMWLPAMPQVSMWDQTADTKSSTAASVRSPSGIVLPPARPCWATTTSRSG